MKFNIGDIVYSYSDVYGAYRIGRIGKIEGLKIYCNFDTYYEIPNPIKIPQITNKSDLTYRYVNNLTLLSRSNLNRRIS
jgi:hypothetical protein